MISSYANYYKLFKKIKKLLRTSREKRGNTGLCDFAKNNLWRDNKNTILNPKDFTFKFRQAFPSTLFLLQLMPFPKRWRKLDKKISTLRYTEVENQTLLNIVRLKFSF